MAQAEAPSKPVIRGNFTTQFSAEERAALDAAVKETGESIGQFVRVAAMQRAAKLGHRVAVA